MGECRTRKEPRWGEWCDEHLQSADKCKIAALTAEVEELRLQVSLLCAHCPREACRICGTAQAALSKGAK